MSPLDVTLEPEKYKLTVETTPADSTVKFDKSKLEYAPAWSCPGRYDLVISRDGYQPSGAK